ncbi:MAG: rhodanese-like domain-containing protein [Deltaproteobacteria bacterium]|nr:rhodanese-like domain-containing protein [Deltaproteobacteria bacterium]
MSKSAQQLLQEAKTRVKEVTPQEAKERLKKGNLLFLDVREPQEVAQGKIEGALPIPRGLLELQIEKVVPNRNQEIVCYCAGGVRSLLAADTLKEMGYENVSSMIGGFKNWVP